MSLLNIKYPGLGDWFLDKGLDLSIHFIFTGSYIIRTYLNSSIRSLMSCSKPPIHPLILISRFHLYVRIQALVVYKQRCKDTLKGSLSIWSIGVRAETSPIQAELGDAIHPIIILLLTHRLLYGSPEDHGLFRHLLIYY